MLSWCSTTVSPSHFCSQKLIKWNETGFNSNGLESGIILDKKSRKGDPLPAGIISSCQTHPPFQFVFHWLIDIQAMMIPNYKWGNGGSDRGRDLCNRPSRACVAKQNLGFRVQSGCGVALPGLLQTAFRPLWPPSAPTDRCAFLAPGEKTRADLSRSLLLLPAGRSWEEYRVSVVAQKPQGCFKLERVVSSVLGGGHLLRKRRNFGGPKRFEGPCLSNCGKKKYKFTWKT